MPVANRLTNDRVVAHHHEIHRKKLSSIKACIDNSRPKTATHLLVNLKKRQMTEERFSTIERENRLLLEKMSFIMQNKGGVDNRNESLQYSHSLNTDYRRRQLMKITSENQGILKRIQTSSPTYKHAKWDEEYAKNLDLMKNISEYEYKPPASVSRPRTALSSSTSTRPGSKSSSSSRGKVSMSTGNAIVSPSPWGTNATNDLPPRPKTSYGPKGSRDNSELPLSLNLAPVKTPQSRDGSDVLLYNVARAISGSDKMYRISIWDQGCMTARKEDASKGVKLLLEHAEEDPAITSKNLEVILSLSQLKSMVSASAVLTASLKDGVQVLDQHEQLHSRIYSALGMDFDPRLAMELGESILSQVSVNKEGDALYISNAAPVVPATSEGRTSDFWSELERKQQI